MWRRFIFGLGSKEIQGCCRCCDSTAAAAAAASGRDCHNIAASWCGEGCGAVDCEEEGEKGGSFHGQVEQSPSTTTTSLSTTEHVERREVSGPILAGEDEQLRSLAGDHNTLHPRLDSALEEQ